MRRRTTACLALLACSSAMGQIPAPVLEEVFPPALEIGKVTRVTLAGKRLERVAGLVFDDPAIHAVLVETKDESKKPPVTTTLTWDVTADAAAAPGLHDLRVENAFGLSAPRAVHVATTPVAAGKDPEKGKPVEIEVADGVRIPGRIEEGEMDRFTLKAARSGTLVVECFGERIDSKVDATLEVRDAAGKRIAASRDAAGADPVLAFEAREGVEYTIDVWDFTYRGKFPYLLAAGYGPRVLFAFPPVLAANEETEATFYGWNLPGARDAVKGGLLQALPARVTAPPADAAGARPYRATTGLLGAVAYVAPAGLPAEVVPFSLAARPPVVEVEPNDGAAKAMALAVPADICGRFDAPGDRDWFRFAARKGEAVDIEVRSSRLGAPCDPVLLIARLESKDGKEKLRDVLYLDERKASFPKEDYFDRKLLQPSRDPEASWTPPEDGDYLLQVRNRNGRSGPDAIYQISLRSPEPGFVLVVTHAENYAGEAPTVPRGAAAPLDLVVDRSGGFTGSIRVTAEDLPPGLSCDPIWLGPDESFAPLAVRAAPDAPEGAKTFRVVGTAEWKGAELRSEALPSVMVYGGSEMRHPLGYSHSRLAHGVAAAVRGDAPFAVTLEPAEVTATPGTKVTLTAKVTRAAGFEQPIQLAYQGLGEKSYAEDNGNRPAKATVEKDKTEQKIEVSLKNEVPYGERGFAVYATAQVDYPENAEDPKSPKKKKRTTLVSNPVLVRVMAPFALTAPEIAAVLPAGGSIKVPFELKRMAGIEDEVEVSIDLPKGVKGLAASAVKLKKDESSGEIVLTSDLDAPAGEMPGLKIRARAQIGGKSFEEKSACPYVVRRVEPLRLVAGEVPTEVASGALVNVPIKVERIGGFDGEVTISLKAPKGSKAAAAEPLVLPRGEHEGELHVTVGHEAAGSLGGLVVEASIERGGKRFAATAPLREMKIAPALEAVGAESGAFGALRVLLRRHADLRPGEDIRVRVKAVSPAGVESGEVEGLLPKGDAAHAVLVDVEPFAGEPDAKLFPLKLRVTLCLKEGEVAEEVLVKGRK